MSAENTAPAAKYNGDFESALRRIGGRVFNRHGACHIYFNYLATWLGLETDLLTNGKVANATLHGEKLSASVARRIIAQLAGARVWYDCDKHVFVGAGCGGHQKPIVAAICAAAERAMEMSQWPLA